MHWFDSWSCWSMGGMWGAWLAVLALVVGLPWLLLSGRLGQKGTQESPQDILKKRYAKGEINKEEFEQKMKDLG